MATVFLQHIQIMRNVIYFYRRYDLQFGSFVFKFKYCYVT